MIRTFLRKFYFVPSSTLNLKAKKNIMKIKELISNKDKVVILNIGSGERFLGGELLKGMHKVFNLDLFPYFNVDVVADAHLLPFKSESIDVIICQAVLEHTKAPWKVVEEIHRILKKDGLVYSEVPFLQGFHPSPRDYFRFTINGLEELFSKFDKIDLDVCVGPSSALSWILREYICGIFSFISENKSFLKIGYFISGWLTFPIKYFDLIFSKKSFSHKIPSGIYFIGKKLK